MAQVPSYQVPSHPSGIEMRTQLNAIVLAMIGDNCGPTEPIEKYPGMMWGDTTANRLRRRNNVNDAWIDIGPLDDFLGDVRKSSNDAINAAANKVNKTGDNMSGDLWMNNAAIHLHVPGVIQAWLRADAGMPGCGFINSGNNAWNLMIYENGNVTVRSALNVGTTGNFGGRVTISNGAELCLRGGNSFYMRPGPNGMEWVNNAYNSVVANMDDAGNMWGAEFYARGNLHAGGCTWQTDGNVWMPWAGDYLSNVLGNKVTRNDCQHNSGLSEFGNIVQGDSGHGECTCPNPWVMVGLRGARWETWIRGIVLRNAP